IQQDYSLPVTLLDALLSTDSCAVCLELFEVGQAVRVLPSCGHIFHSTCVDPWLSSSATCPLCRKVRAWSMPSLSRSSGTPILAAE
ncbi:hypothetical protein DUNSADRAFT_15674, partial [Dunaliella salina]